MNNISTRIGRLYNVLAKLNSEYTVARHVSRTACIRKMHDIKDVKSKIDMLNSELITMRSRVAPKVSVHKSGGTMLEIAKITLT